VILKLLGLPGMWTLYGGDFDALNGVDVSDTSYDSDVRGVFHLKIGTSINVKEKMISIATKDTKTVRPRIRGSIFHIAL
jgi:hypothetical protein